MCGDHDVHFSIISLYLNDSNGMAIQRPPDGHGKKPAFDQYVSKRNKATYRNQSPRPWSQAPKSRGLLLESPKGRNCDLDFLGKPKPGTKDLEPVPVATGKSVKSWMTLQSRQSPVHLFLLPIPSPPQSSRL